MNSLCLDLEEWISVCAVADIYGFAPSTQPWRDARAGMIAREGKIKGMGWWNESIFLVSNFTAEEQAVFVLALHLAKGDRYAQVEKEITEDDTSPRSYSLQAYQRTSFRYLLNEVATLAEQGPFQWKRESIGRKRWVFRLYAIESDQET